jgi:hypothetical protein
VAAIFGVIALGALVVLGVILAVDSRHLDDPMLLGLSLVSAVMALVLLVGSAVAGILVVSGSEVGRGFAFGVSGYAAVDYLSRALSDSIVSWTSGWPIAQVVTALLSFAISGAAITAFALLLSRPVTNWFHEVRAAKTGSSAPAAPAYQ